jgi:hypothetical protein
MLLPCSESNVLGIIGNILPRNSVSGILAFSFPPNSSG